MDDIVLSTKPTGRKRSLSEDNSDSLKKSKTPHVTSIAAAADLIQNTPHFEDSSFDTCNFCNALLFMDIQQNALICNSCGTWKECPDPGGSIMSVAYTNLEKRDSVLDHKRTRKLKEFLKQLTSKQKSIVPMNILLEISERMYSAGIDRDGITYQALTRIIVSEFKRFSDYTMQIYCQIKGCHPPQIHPRDEEAICIIFAAIQKPFEKIRLDSDRSTFFSMSYLLLVICKFLKYDYLLKYIPLQKTRTKLSTQQTMLRKVWDSLGWADFPGLTDEEICNFSL